MGETKVSCPFTDIIEDLKERISGLKYRYWSPCIKTGGYSGTAIFSKKEPINVIYGLENDLDDEGRVITLEFKKFFLIHVYTPNSGRALERLKWRTETWDKAFLKHIEKLKKPVIVCGDLNVAHKEIDIKNSKTNLKTAGFTVEERESFSNILEKANLIDTFRYKHPEEIKYSFWSYMRNARAKNIGWRLDYFLVTDKLKTKISKSDILTDVQGSDHAPIKLIIKL
jgi:exodeoxyribonuclease-3